MSAANARPPLIGFDAPVWRLLPAALGASPSAPARAPEGRFHHAGQVAAYCSLSAEGAAVAIRRYLGDGVARVLIPMHLATPLAADMRGHAAASVVWQDERAAGAPAPTWAISDAARAAGAEAMLYASRSRPDLTHVVVFAPARLIAVGPPVPFVP